MKLKINNTKFEVETAETHEEHSTGLSGREEIKTGMLFIFDDEQRRSFHMENTLQPLSIAFVASSGKIEEIKEGQPQTTERIRSDTPVKYVLEMPQGFFEENSISIGDSLEFIEESNMHEKIEKYLNDEIDEDEVLGGDVKQEQVDSYADYRERIELMGKSIIDIVQRDPGVDVHDLIFETVGNSRLVLFFANALDVLKLSDSEPEPHHWNSRNTWRDAITGMVFGMVEGDLQDWLRRNSDVL